MSHKAKPLPALYVSTMACANALGFTTETMRRWFKRGLVSGVTFQTGPANYFDPPRKTGRGRILLELRSLEAMLTRAWTGGEVPKSLLQRLRSLARPLPGKSP